MKLGVMKVSGLCLSLLTIARSLAVDFGTCGHVYEILEPDLLVQITQKLHQLDSSGALDRHNQKLLNVAKKRLQNPKPVSLPPATQARTFFFDPTIRVPFDLKDQKGHIFHKQGTALNPLAYQSLSKPLLFLDGRREAQVAWAQSQKETNEAKVILTAGSPFELMKALEKPVYFDQGGRLTQKLGIKHTPALVTQEGLSLKVQEIPEAP